MPLASVLRRRLPQPFFNQSKLLKGKVSTLLFILLFSLTILGTTHNFRFTMMGLITFVLAYLSKGIRRRSP